MINARVRADLRGLRKIQAAMTAGNADPRIRAMQTAWCDRYSRFADERWQKFSRGGGDWQPLAPATIARRQKLGRTMKTILLVTRNLIAALRRGTPGNVLAFIDRNRVRFGVGGGARHPDTGIRPGEPAMTFGEMAVIHHAGSPARRIPARPIIVLPDVATGDDLVRIAVRHTADIINRP